MKFSKFSRKSQVFLTILTEILNFSHEGRKAVIWAQKRGPTLTGKSSPKGIIVESYSNSL